MFVPPYCYRIMLAARDLWKHLGSHVSLQVLLGTGKGVLEGLENFLNNLKKTKQEKEGNLSSVKSCDSSLSQSNQYLNISEKIAPVSEEGNFVLPLSK